MKNEVFAERVGPSLFFDGPLYFQTGAETFRRQNTRGLYRLRYDVGNGAVKWEFLASFHARIIAREVAEDGRELAVVAGRGVAGRSFLFRCSMECFAAPNSANAKRFLKTFCNARGTLPSFVMPGRLAATLRTIAALSEEGEPIPHSAAELANLDG
jgi:hypothetical protein